MKEHSKQLMSYMAKVKNYRLQRRMSFKSEEISEASEVMNYQPQMFSDDEPSQEIIYD